MPELRITEETLRATKTQSDSEPEEHEDFHSCYDGEASEYESSDQLEAWQVQQNALESSEGSQDEAEPVLYQEAGNVPHKGQRRHIRSAVEEITAAYAAEKDMHKDETTKAKPTTPPRRKPGPWRMLEVFTWTCCLMAMAISSGWVGLEHDNVAQMGLAAINIS